MFAVVFICILREGIRKNRKTIITRKNFVSQGSFYKNVLPLAFF